jgi:hypothetical protein
VTLAGRRGYDRYSSLSTRGLTGAPLVWDTHAVTLSPDVVLAHAPDGARPLGAATCELKET